jgi:hypothetical protein
MIRRILRSLGVGRRWGVRYGGDKERTGFTSRTAAETFGQDTGRAYVCFDYEPLDLRIDASRASSSRDRFVGGGAA